MQMRRRLEDARHRDLLGYDTRRACLTMLRHSCIRFPPSHRRLVSLRACINRSSAWHGTVYTKSGHEFFRHAQISEAPQVPVIVSWSLVFHPIAWYSRSGSPTCSISGIVHRRSNAFDKTILKICAHSIIMMLYTPPARQKSMH